MKEIRAKRLNEDHKVEEYKGYELDFNTDLLDTEEESVVINVRVIDKNGKVLTTQRGFRKAREFVDKLVAEEERKIDIELETDYSETYDDEDGWFISLNLKIKDPETQKKLQKHITKLDDYDYNFDIDVYEKPNTKGIYDSVIYFWWYGNGDGGEGPVVYKTKNNTELEFIDNTDEENLKLKPGAKERIEKLVKDFIKKEILKTLIVKEEKMEENLNENNEEKEDYKFKVNGINYYIKLYPEDRGYIAKWWDDSDNGLGYNNNGFVKLSHTLANLKGNENKDIREFVILNSTHDRQLPKPIENKIIDKVVELKKLDKRIEEGKKLNEGAGAGYNAEGELYEIKIDKILDIKTEVEEIEEYDPVSIATIKVEGTGKFDGAVYDYYGYGARLEESEVKIKELSVNINIFEYTNNEEENYQNITVEDLNDLFYGRYIKIKSRVIGPGWIHTKFTGENISLKEIDESSYSLNDIVFDFVNEEDIKEVEYGLTHQEDEYEDDLEECFARELDEETKSAITKEEKLKEDVNNSNILEFPSGDYLYVEKKDGKLIAGGATNVGIIPEFEIEYEEDFSYDWNLGVLYDMILETRPEYNEYKIKEEIEETKGLPKLTKEEAEEIAKEEYLFGIHEAVEKLEEKGFDCKEFFDRVERISEDEIPAMVVEEAKEELYKKLGIEVIMAEARDTVWDRADDDEFLFM